MKVTRLDICSPGSISNELITHLSFSFNAEDHTSPYILKKIDGLNPDEIIRTYNDGPAYFRLRPKDKKVDVHIKTNPDYKNNISIGELRDYLYNLVAFNTRAVTWNDDTKLQFRFFNGSDYVCSLFGVVSKIDTDIFSNSSNLILSLECDDPFFRSTQDVDLSANIMLDSNVSHIVGGTRLINVESAFYCNDAKSTAPHGFRMELECISEPPYTELWPKQFIIWDSRNVQKYLFASSFDFQVGDTISFSSEEDNRYFKITHSGNTYDMLNTFYWGSIWPFISPGENFFEVSEGFNIKSVNHRYSYWGV